MTGNDAIGEIINMLTAQLPNALGLGFAVFIAAMLVDRRRLTDLGLEINRQWWRGLAGGTLVGAGITLLAILVGLGIGYYELTGVVLPTGPGVWVVVAAGAALFQLLFVVPEELFVRGYIITNITEGLDGVPSIPRGVAAAVGIAVSSLRGCSRGYFALGTVPLNCSPNSSAGSARTLSAPAADGSRRALRD